MNGHHYWTHEGDVWKDQRQQRVNLDRAELAAVLAECGGDHVQAAAWLRQDCHEIALRVHRHSQQAEDRFPLARYGPESFAGISPARAARAMRHLSRKRFLWGGRDEDQVYTDASTDGPPCPECGRFTSPSSHHLSWEREHGGEETLIEARPPITYRCVICDPDPGLEAFMLRRYIEEWCVHLDNADHWPSADTFFYSAYKVFGAPEGETLPRAADEMASRAKKIENTAAWARLIAAGQLAWRRSPHRVRGDHMFLAPTDEALVAAGRGDYAGRGVLTLF